MWLCARPGPDADTAAQVEDLVRQDLDCDYLFQLAQRHCVLPLLHRRFEGLADGALRRRLQPKLRQYFRDNAARNLLLAGELVRITRALKSEGIATLAYKGPALALLAYGDLSLRQFIDLDIIVDSRDVNRAREILRDRGFCAPEFSKSQDDLLQRLQHNVALMRADDGLVVELHWRLAARGFAVLPFEQHLWGRATTVSVCGARVETLSPEDLLLALCIHGAKHFWERLSWVCDLAQLVSSHPRLDWPLVFKLAAEAGIERMLSLGLVLAVELLDVPPPPEVMRIVSEDAAAPRLASQVIERMFDGARFAPLGFHRAISFNLRVRPRWSEKARYCRYLLAPTDADLTTRRVPARLEFAYYVARPFRLIWKAKQPLTR